MQRANHPTQTMDVKWARILPGAGFVHISINDPLFDCPVFRQLLTPDELDVRSTRQDSRWGIPAELLARRIDLAFCEKYVDVYGCVPPRAMMCVFGEQSYRPHRSQEEVMRILRYLAAHRDQSDTRTTNTCVFVQGALRSIPEVIRFMILEFGMTVSPGDVVSVMHNRNGLPALDVLVDCGVHIDDDLYRNATMSLLTQIRFFHERRGMPLTSELWSLPTTFRNAPWGYLALHGCPLDGWTLQPCQLVDILEFAQDNPDKSHTVLANIGRPLTILDTFNNDDSDDDDYVPELEPMPDTEGELFMV